MPTPTIPNGEEHFFINKYKGNGGGQRVGRFLPFSSTGSIANSVIFNDDDNESVANFKSLVVEIFISGFCEKIFSNSVTKFILKKYAKPFTKIKIINSPHNRPSIIT